ncbi:hypothetical protein Tco_0385116, partial [Tanacetum coccineum]
MKEKHDGLGNTDVLIGSCSEYGFPLLSGGAPWVSTREGGLQNGNTGNGEATRQVHEVTNDGIPNEAGFNYGMKEAPTSYANKLSPTIKANFRKLDANVPNDADFDIWLPLASVSEVNNRMKNLLYGYVISKKLAFLVVEWFVRNNWKMYGLEKVTLVKGFFIFKFSSTEGVDSLWVKLDSHEIGTPMMLDSYMNYVCLESWGRSNYARFFIEIDACNGFIDNLFMVVPNLDGPGYTKETIHVEYKDKGRSSGANDDGFIQVKKKKSGGNNRGTKNFKLVSVKPKTIYCHKVNQLSVEASPKTAPSADKKSFTPLVEKINMFKHQLLKGKCMLLDDEGKPLEKIDYTGEHDSEDEVKPVDNEMESFLASKPSGLVMEIPDNLKSLCDNLDIK